MLFVPRSPLGYASRLMGRLFGRLVDLRDGEGPALARTAVILFGLIAGHTMLETARDALFLGTLPPVRLTWVYALLAVLALGFSEVNNRFVGLFGRRNALILTLIFAAFGTVLFYLRPMRGPEVFGLYLWSAVLGTVLVVQFWLLAGHVFTVSQGKRLFGILAAGGVLGAVVGALVSVAAVRFAGVHELLVGAAALFLATAWVATTMPSDELAEDIRRLHRQRRRWAGGFRALQEQPFLLRLAMATGLATMAVLTCDYLFKSVAASRFTPEELGPFFAQYYALLNSVALAAQVLVAGALVRRLGTIAAFLVLPGLLVAGGAGIMLSGAALGSILLTKGADGALRHSLHRISLELLWMPVDDALKNRTKPLVDAVGVRGSQALAAGGLFVLASFGVDRPMVLSGVLAALAVAWLCLGFSLRRPYLDLFRDALRREGPNEAHGALRLDIRSVEVVVEALSSRNEEQVLAAIDLLASNGHDRLIPALILYHESEAVLLRALDTITHPDRKDWVALAERLLTHASEPVRVKALQVLARAGYIGPVEERLLDVSPMVRGQAAFWLASKETGERPASDHPAVRQIFEMSGPAGARAQVGVLEAVRDSGDRRWAETLLECAENKEGSVSEAALIAMAKVPDPRFIPALIARLDRRDQRPLVRDALVALGNPAREALARAVQDPSLPRSIRIHVPRSISKFRDQAAADLLFEILQHEPDGAIRYKALRGLGRLVAEQPEVRIDMARIEARAQHELLEYLRMLSLELPLRRSLAGAPPRSRASGELLCDLLVDKQKQAMERAFRLLQIAHPRESIHSVATALESRDRKVRARALEYIEALTLASKAPQHREVLRLVGDDLEPEERLRRASPFLERVPKTGDEALSTLIREPDEAVASLAAYHALERGDEALRKDVAAVSEHRSLGSSLQSFLELKAAREETPDVA